MCPQHGAVTGCRSADRTASRISELRCQRQSLGGPRSPLRPLWTALGMGVLADSDASGCPARAQPGRCSWHLPLAGTVFSSLPRTGRATKPTAAGVRRPARGPGRAERGSASGQQSRLPAGCGGSQGLARGDVAGIVVPPPACGWRLKTWLWSMSHRGR